mmetsp:Transcript_47881/g.70868  ORF Transcript_47881/g.70868 Transcript_47881/m.70868 type:complete len:133 (+) Transcript_47881:249-647(+)
MSIIREENNIYHRIQVEINRPRVTEDAHENQEREWELDMQARWTPLNIITIMTLSGRMMTTFLVLVNKKTIFQCSVLSVHMSYLACSSFYFPPSPLRAELPIAGQRESYKQCCEWQNKEKNSFEFVCLPISN